MTFRNYLLSMTVLLTLVSAASAQRVAGVWRLDSVTSTDGKASRTTKTTQPSMYLFTKSHYSIIYVASDKPRSTDDPKKMTVDQLNDVYVNSFVANAGTYAVMGGKLTFKIMVAKSPTYMSGGNWVTYKAKIVGNTMTLVEDSDKDGPIKDPDTLTLTRVE